MQPVAAIHRTTRPPAINNTLTVTVAADADTTQRVLDELDLAALAIRATHALGIANHITLTRGGLSWRPHSGSGHIDVDVDAHVEPDVEDSSALTIITRFRASDDRTHERLLDAWPLVNSVARQLVQRGARTVKGYAEDRDQPQALDDHLRAAA
jgi:hypothetical protein